MEVMLTNLFIDTACFLLLKPKESPQLNKRKNEFKPETFSIGEFFVILQLKSCGMHRVAPLCGI